MSGDLGHSVLALRQRSAWEAWDAGILLWRGSLGASLLLLALPLCACALAFRVLLSPVNPALAWLAIWWIKPLLDRPLLHFLSKRFVEPELGPRAACRGIWKSIFTGLLADLSWRRFDWARSTRMPLHVLERSSGSRARARWKTMERQQSLSGGLLSGLCLMIEAGLLGGAAFFCYQMIEMGGAAQALWAVLGGGSLVEPAFYAGFCLGMAVMEPLYVAMGFAQYMNRRVGTEGWDLKMRFKALADQAQAQDGLEGSKRRPRASAPMTGLALLFCLFFTMAGPVPLHAQEPPRESLDAILDAPEFGWEEDGWGIGPRSWGPPGDADIPEGFQGFLEAIKNNIGAVLRVLLLVVLGAILAIGLVFLVARLRGYRGAGRPGLRRLGKTALEAPDLQSLLAAAEDVHARGREREAWALCARALLAAVGMVAGISFPADATEAECLRLAASRRAEGLEGLRTHLGVWVRFAYAGEAPAPQAFGLALAWCRALAARAVAGSDGEGAPE